MNNNFSLVFQLPNCYSLSENIIKSFHHVDNTLQRRAFLSSLINCETFFSPKLFHAVISQCRIQIGQWRKTNYAKSEQAAAWFIKAVICQSHPTFELPTRPTEKLLMRDTNKSCNRFEEAWYWQSFKGGILRTQQYSDSIRNFMLIACLFIRWHWHSSFYCQRYDGMFNKTA